MDYVECILETTVRVQCENERLVGELVLLRDFSEVSKNTFSASFSNEIELAALLTKLNDLGFLFVNAGPGWHPGDVYLDLRDKGLVNGQIETISWSAPNCPVFGRA